MQPIQMQLSPYRKIFSRCFSAFKNLNKILNTFQKKMTVRGYWFLKL